MERTFQLYSPMIAGIEVKRHGDVRRAKLYYLRERSGKAAGVEERLVRRGSLILDAGKPASKPPKASVGSGGFILVHPLKRYGFFRYIQSPL